MKNVSFICLISGPLQNKRKHYIKENGQKSGLLQWWELATLLLPTPANLEELFIGSCCFYSMN